MHDNFILNVKDKNLNIPEHRVSPDENHETNIHPELELQVENFKTTRTNSTTSMDITFSQTEKNDGSD